MAWLFKAKYARRVIVLTVLIDLRRVRWIEPISGSGDWWPFPLNRRG